MENTYFKVYQSLFENETYAPNLTDLEKVLLMFIQSEMNTKEAEAKTAGKAAIMRFSHYWMAAALSTRRKKLSDHLKPLIKYGFFDYTSGYRVNPNTSAPSTIRNLATEKLYAQIDRYTFEYLLFDKLKNKEIKYRHIVVYALCKYIEQFHDGSVSVNEFGRMLGMTAKEIKYDRIKKPLEDLQAMKLIDFQKMHGEITGIKAAALPLNRGNRQRLRESVQAEANEKRYAEKGINPETAAAVEDMQAPGTLDDILDNVKDGYAKRTGKKAVLTADQKQRIQSTTLTVKEIHDITIHFFTDPNQNRRIHAADGKSIFGVYANYVLSKQLERDYSPV